MIVEEQYQDGLGETIKVKLVIVCGRGTRKKTDGDSHSFKIECTG